MMFRFSCTLFAVSALLLLVSSLPRTLTNELEDEYIGYFGNDPHNYTGWLIAKHWFYMDGEPMLRKFCAEVHKQAGKGEYIVDYVLLKNRVLQFENVEYVPRRVDVVEYSIQEENATIKVTTSWKWKEHGQKWHITEGIRPDCIYYLNLDNKEDLLFSLKEPVCGVKIT